MDTTTPSPDHPDPVDGLEATSPRRRRLLAVAALAFAVPVVGLVSYGVADAQGTDDPPTVVDEDLVVATVGGDADCTDVEPLPPDEIAALNADEEALAAYLDQRGISYTWETGVDGLRYVAVDDGDEAALEAVDEFYAELYGDVAPAPPLSAEEIAAFNEEEDALAAFLDEHGIAYTRETDADGVDLVVWDYDDPAATEAVNEFYAELYGDVGACLTSDVVVLAEGG